MNLSGKISYPIGESGSIKIRITAMETLGESLKGTEGIGWTDEQGNYSFNMMDGIYLNEALFTDEYVEL